MLKANSFSYSGSPLGASANELSGGPRLDTHFTPWILGGGYTDGLAGSGFCGAKNFGTISGFRGHLGSTKFYDRALTTQEVSNNYEAQKTIFENVKTIKTYSEDGT